MGFASSVTCTSVCSEEWRATAFNTDAMVPGSARLGVPVLTYIHTHANNMPLHVQVQVALQSENSLGRYPDSLDMNNYRSNLGTIQIPSAKLTRKYITKMFVSIAKAISTCNSEGVCQQNTNTLVLIYNSLRER